MSGRDEFTLEKLGIRKDLSDLMSKIDTHIANHEIRMLVLEKDVSSLNHTVNGNGKVGLVGKLDSIEKRNEEYKANGIIAKTAGVGLICKVVYDFFFHHIR